VAFLLSNQNPVAAELFRSADQLHGENTGPANDIPRGKLDLVGVPLTASLTVSAPLPGSAVLRRRRLPARQPADGQVPV